VTDQAALYEEAKTGLQAVSEPLFELGEKLVRKHGAFLPFGAILSRDGTVGMHGAAGESERANDAEILPLLHDGLRSALNEDTVVLAVCEWVKITPPAGKQTDAIKVLAEHSNGLTVAFYLPMTKRLLGGWQAGEVAVTPATPEVRGF